MSQPAIYLLLFLALVLPVPGAFAVRLLAGRIGERGVLLGATGFVLLAIISALALARADVPLLRVGDLTLFLPSTRLSDDQSAPPEPLPASGPDELPPDSGPPSIPTLTPRPSATPRPTATRLPTATPPPSATPEPTATATPEPPSATPEPPAGGRRYTVQPGDTFRAIAERFEVTVVALLSANGLTPAQADSLRVGQELVIP